MTNDAKEWVTIKVPKDVRDDARDDPRTYGEVMRDGLDVDGDAADIPEVGEMLDWEGVAEAYRETEEGKELLEQLDRIESAAATAEQRTGTIERKVDDLAGGR